MPSTPMKKRKRDQPRYWVLMLALGCSVLAFVWILVPPRRVSENRPPITDPQAVINYPKLIDYYDGEEDSFTYLAARGCLGFVAFLIIGPILMVLFVRFKRLARAPVVLAIILPGVLISCWGMFTGCRLTINDLSAPYMLEHIDTAEFDGQMYQLTYMLYSPRGVPWSDALYIYQCDLSGVDCVFLDWVPYHDTVPVVQSADPKNVSFVIDQNHDQLQVRENDAVFFVLDAQRDMIP